MCKFIIIVNILIIEYVKTIKLFLVLYLSYRIKVIVKDLYNVNLVKKIIYIIRDITIVLDFYYDYKAFL